MPCSHDCHATDYLAPTHRLMPTVDLLTIVAGSTVMVYLILYLILILYTLVIKSIISAEEEPVSERDFQKQKLYDWERKELTKSRPLNKILRRTEIFRFYHSVCDELELSREKRPSLTFHKHRRNAIYWHARNRINMPPWSWKRWVVLHELAHHLSDSKNGPGKSAHGPLFVKEFIYLLARFSRVGQKRLVDSLTKARVQFDLYPETSNGTQSEEDRIQETA